MPPGGFRDYVESVRAALDIAQVVGEAVTLRKAGRSLVGLCPFHQERTPSFHVDPAKGLYYCFGCGAGGDAFKFVMNFHQVEFAEAVTMLGDRLGLSRPAPATPAEAQEDRRRRKILEALSAAQEHFAACLAAGEGGGARAYLARRGLSPDHARHFGLGFAPPGWDNLLRRLSARGFQVEDLVRSGLAVPRPGGDGMYDRFRNRLTFPIRDTAGRIVSFGGRSLGEEDPKYLNGPETLVYDKSRTLFRLYDAAPEIRQTGRVVVVEGYFDAVSLGAVGTPGVVAVCGTALSSTHARLLRRYAEQVVLFFDGDDAGHKAAHRALDPLLAEGLPVRVAAPPAGKDPDDLAREGGAPAVESCLGAAEDLPGFLVSEARRLFDLTSLDGRVKAMEMMLGHLVQLDSPLARAEAGARAAQGLGVEDDVFREELRRAARDRRRDAPPRAAMASRPRRLSEAEIQLLRFLAEVGPQVPEEAERLIEALPQDALSPLARKLIGLWSEFHGRGEWLTLRRLAELAPGDGAADILSLAFAQAPPPDVAEAWGAVGAVRQSHLEAQTAALQEQITLAEKAGDRTAVDRLTLQKFAIERERRGLAPGA